MSDINGGQSPNPNGSPIFPGTLFTGPVLTGNIAHSDGSGALASVGETNTGTANVGYCQAVQTAAGITSAGGTSVTTSIVIPAQSQITDIYLMVTTVQAGGTFSIGTTAGGATALTNSVSGLGTISQLAITIIPSTGPQALLWDNVGNTDVQITITFNATGAFVGTLSVFYIQGINNVS
jgi:hypothetical protein